MLQDGSIRCAQAGGPSQASRMPCFSPGIHCKASRGLEGGINMQDRSNLRCRLRSPMRHADTYGPHHVAPCVGCVPDGIHGNTVENLPRRLVPGPYEGPVVLPYLPLKG